MLAALGVVLAFATGCGGGSNGSANTEATKSVDQIVADAESAANNANSVHVAGGAVRGRTPLQLNLDLVAGKGGKGHLTVNGLSFDIIRIGEVAYFKGDATFWRHLGSKFAAQLLEGRWRVSALRKAIFGERGQRGRIWIDDAVRAGPALAPSSSAGSKGADQGSSS